MYVITNTHAGIDMHKTEMPKKVTMFKNASNPLPLENKVLNTLVKHLM